MRLAGKVALISGAAGGMGAKLDRAIEAALAKKIPNLAALFAPAKLK